MSESKKSRIRDEFYEWLDVAKFSIMDWPHDGIPELKAACDHAVDIVDLICKYVEKHGDIALSIGSEWLYQDDDAQVDALQLVGDILDALRNFAE